MLAHEIRNKIRALSSSADALGVTLPAPVAEILSADLDLPAPFVADRDAAVEEIVAAVGSRSYPKTRDAVLDRLARADAADKVRDRATNALDARRFATMVEHGPEILALFAEALAEDLETLNREAPKVPGTTNPGNVSSLSPEQYAAHFAASRSASRLEATAQALAPLLGVGSGGGGYGVGPLDVPARLFRVALADLSGVPEERGLDVVRGLLDHRDVRTGVGDETRAVLWWARLAECGVRFALAACAAEVAERRAVLDAWNRKPRNMID